LFQQFLNAGGTPLMIGHQKPLKAEKTFAGQSCRINFKRLFLTILTCVLVFSAAAPVLATTLLDPSGNGSPAIDGKAFVLYDAQSGMFLLGKSQDTPMPPASITKVMTVLLAMEKLKMEDTITITRDMYKTIPNDYMRLGLTEGEVITVEEALYACLLISANDAAMALAFKMGGSVEGFAEMMNARAKELGCKNTHFTNPYGLADKEHLTTAHDMALITAEALEHKTYTQISTTKHYQMKATNLHAEERGLSNINPFVSSATYSYEYYIGGKTGFTNLSGYTIVAGARKENRTLIAVILNATASKIRYENLISLLNYGYAAFANQKVDAAEFAELKAQAESQVADGIESSGYDFEITGSELNLDEYVTEGSSKGGHTCLAGTCESPLQADLPSQVASYPLYYEYSDGSRIQVGTLDITVSKKEMAETSTAAATTAADHPGEGTGAGTSVLRVILILVLAAVTAFCLLLLLAMVRRDLRRRRRRKRRSHML
jgi:D-alanyl-D-alanine carboxypeptidase